MKRTFALVAAALGLAGVPAGSARADVTVCYDVEATVAGQAVVDEAACQTVTPPAPPA